MKRNSTLPAGDLSLLHCEWIRSIDDAGRTKIEDERNSSMGIRVFVYYLSRWIGAIWLGWGQLLKTF